MPLKTSDYRLIASAVELHPMTVRRAIEDNLGSERIKNLIRQGAKLCGVELPNAHRRTA